MTDEMTCKECEHLEIGYLCSRGEDCYGTKSDYLKAYIAVLEDEICTLREAKEKHLLTIGEQEEILQYIRDDINGKEIDNDKLPQWLAKLRESYDECMRQYDHQQERACNAEEKLSTLEAEKNRLIGILSGDPGLTATKEQREAWRWAAVRYANKLEQRIESITPGGSEFHDSMEVCFQWIEKRIATTAKIAGERNKLEAELSTLREQNRWIPVGERLPSKADCATDAGGRVIPYVIGCINGYLYGLVFIDHFDSGSSVYTHWRPLPEPPEVQE